ncbi:unnamed protein product, partial [Coregonus sp. 'balchen']
MQDGSSHHDNTKLPDPPPPPLELLLRIQPLMKLKATTTTAKLNAAPAPDPATVTATAKTKPKATSTTAKLKASQPALEPKLLLRFHCKRGLNYPLRQPELLPHYPMILYHGAKCEARPFWQKVELGSSREEVEEEKLQWSGSDHTTSTADLKPDRLYSKTTALDHNPTITSDLNKDSLSSKTSNRGPLSRLTLFKPQPQTLPSVVAVKLAKPATANQSVTRERAPLNARMYGTEQRIMGALSLGEVRLKELPGWIASRAPRNPRQGILALHR